MTAPRWIFRTALVVFSMAAVLLLLPVPMFYWEAGASGAETNWGDVFSLERQSTLLMRSTMVAGGSALIATAFGITVAVGALRVRPSVRTTIGILCGASLCMPPYVFAVAWIDVWGPAGWFGADGMPLGTVVYAGPGASLALAASYYPFVAFAAYVALRRVNPNWREAAAVSGSVRYYGYAILGPAVLPPIAAAALVVFLLALYEFPVHSLMQLNTYLVEIHAAASYHDYAAAAALSTPLVVVTAIVCTAVAGLMRLPAPDSDASVPRQQREASSSLAGMAAVATWPVVALCSVMPLLLVAVRSMPLDTYVGLTETAWTEFLTSSVLAAIAATVLTLLGIVAAMLRPRSHVRAALDVASAVPFLVSGPLLGLGLIALFNRPGPLGSIYDSAAVVILAWSARFWFVAQWGIGVGIRRHAANGVEAAAVAGAGWFRTQFGVVLAQAWPYIVTVWAVSFVLSFREIDTAVLVAPAGLTLVSERLFTLMHYGPDRYVMAMAFAMSALLVGFGGTAYGLARRASRWNNART